MATLNQTAAILNVEIDAGTQDVIFTWPSLADQTGTWVCKIRDKFESATAQLTITVNVSQAAAAEIRVPITLAECLARIQTGADRYVGEYDLAKDNQVKFKGAWIINQTASLR